MSEEQSAPEPLAPQAEALSLIPETMAVVYNILPLTYKDGVLTVAGVSADASSLNDVKSLLGFKDIRIARTCTREEIAKALAKHYGSALYDGSFLSI